ncbi:hypothetical protein BCR32DRAFT_266687 [Anaeromyces robustus]|uniref:G-protein coupled receptors family 3 profile domain-containing protein n=1 Tax=Anaeromyces robustus TaxID=1754192 RepID=A0A1Y1XEN1_9FUNG|nr:hypothetical protein BCR32DRAFT_266687 [Anaeromyces robustus]|eukprot:ORX83896.1 hypothetical protein BCR32DRAFT_266687 [Anaeromyces robustus]
MYKIYKNIINILYFIIFCFNIVNAQDKKVINILLSRPEINESRYLENYNQIIKEYFSTRSSLNNYDINFSFCEPVADDGKDIIQDYEHPMFFSTNFVLDEDYPKNFNCTIRELKESKFDMMILDNNFIFSDDSFVKSIYLNGKYLIRRITDYYEDLNDHGVKEEDTKHHDADILNNGHFKDPRFENKRFFGLPYERDFNLLYYHNKYEAIKDILSEKELTKDNLNTNVLYDSYLEPGGILSIGLKDYDEILSAFDEFISYKYGIPKENDVKSFDIFYNRDQNNKKLDELFYSFRNYTIKYSGQNIEKTLETTPEQAYYSFINNEKIFLKGKASFYKKLIDNPNIAILANSLPDNFSTIKEKFLIINNNSEKPKNDLVKIALQLTSPEIQLYRAEVLGTIPTFDLKNFNKNEYSNAYCTKNPVICNIFKDIKPIQVNKFFKKNKNTANFMEIRMVVPPAIKDGLIKNNDTVLEETFLNTLDLEPIPMSDMKTPIVIINGINLIGILILVIAIIMVIRYRKHPYLKAISPYLSCLTILGMIISLSFIYIFALSSVSKTACRLSYVVKVTSINLIYLPMISIIFRIYYIYTNLSKVNYGKKVNDKRLIRYVFIILILFILICGMVAFNDDFYIGTFGTLLPLRLNLCVYQNMLLYYLFANIYSVIMFISMIVMTIKTIQVSRKFGEVKFILFIVLLLFASVVYEITFIFLATFNFNNIYLFAIAHGVYLISSLYCAYLLVGSRLLYIRKHPIKNGTYKGNSVYNDYFNTTINLADFIPLKKDLKKDYNKDMDREDEKINKNKNKNRNRSNSSNSHGSNYNNEYINNYINGYNDYLNSYNNTTNHQNEEYIDPIESNPNNYFFNQSLKMLSNENDANNNFYNRRN